MARRGGAARPGMREVADRAGVAMSSVSRVLSGHPDVSPKMRQIVMAAVRDLGYRPDMLAQGLRRGKTFSVGFTVSDIANPVLAEIVTGAEKRLREAATRCCSLCAGRFTAADDTGIGSETASGRRRRAARAGDEFRRQDDLARRADPAL